MEKNFPKRLQKLNRDSLQSPLRVWAFDEHRVGLVPTQRRAWFPWWVVPMSPFRWKFDWSWVYGFVEPSTGETDWFLMPRVNYPSLSLVLKEFAHTHQIDTDNPAVIVLDNARWHTTKQLKIPTGIHLMFLPAYSPELQPAERLWPLVDEAIENRAFDSIEQLEEVIAERCIQLAQQPDYVKRFTHFHWWPIIKTGTV